MSFHVRMPHGDNPMRVSIDTRKTSDAASQPFLLLTRSQHPAAEDTGPVTYDSLAADSVRHHGPFEENTAHAPLNPDGSRATVGKTHMTEQTGATKLEPAFNAEERLDKEESKFGPTQYHPPGDEHRALSPYGNDPPTGNHAAPSYVEPLIHNPGAMKPHGKNIREGGFDVDDRANASFTSDVGSKRDPARVAEYQTVKKDSQNINELSEAPRPFQEPNHHQAQPYDVLGSDASA